MPKQETKGRDSMSVKRIVYIEKNNKSCPDPAPEIIVYLELFITGNAELFLQFYHLKSVSRVEVKKLYAFIFSLQTCIPFSLVTYNCFFFFQKQRKLYLSLYQNLLTLPISGGNPLNELLERSKTKRLNLHASTG